MITLCHAIDDVEVMFIRALLQSEEIPFCIVGECFGSLYPGVQIGSYNERRFIVRKDYYEQAAQLLESHRELYEPSSENITVKSKIRILLEATLLGWCFPNGKKKNSYQ